MRRQLGAVDNSTEKRRRARGGGDTPLRLIPRDPGVFWWQFFICHVHMHLAQRGPGDRLVRQVDCERHDVPVRRHRRRQRLAGHTNERGRRQNCESFTGLHCPTCAARHGSKDPTFNAQYPRLVEGLRKAISRSQLNYDFRSDSGPSQCDPCWRAVRPTATSTTAIRDLRFTSEPARGSTICINRSATDRLKAFAHQLSRIRRRGHRGLNW
jgi:hypothetical protein